MNESKIFEDLLRVKNDPWLEEDFLGFSTLKTSLPLPELACECPPFSGLMVVELWLWLTSWGLETWIGAGADDGADDGELLDPSLARLQNLSFVALFVSTFWSS